MTKKDERTDEELLDGIRRCAKDKKRIPVANDFVNNSRYPSLWAYRSRFGTFNNAIDKSGLQISNYVGIEDDELLGSLMCICEELDRIPDTTDFKNNSKYPCLTTFVRRFGTLSIAIEKLGLDSRKVLYHNETESCDTCGKSFIDLIGWYKPRKEYDDDYNWTGKWCCPDCLTDTRTGKLDPNSHQAKGNNFEELSCRFYCATNLNKDNDNYRMPIDHWCEKLGYFQTRGMYETADGWCFSNLEREWYKNYNKIILYCASEDGQTIDRMYDFPSWDIIERKSVHIRRTKRSSLFDQYRITDEETLKQVNQIWRQILEEKNIHELR